MTTGLTRLRDALHSSRARFPDPDPSILSVWDPAPPEADTSTYVAPAPQLRAGLPKAPPRQQCLQCDLKFDSRNTLFIHLRAQQHGVCTKTVSEFLQACQAQHWSLAAGLWHSGSAVDVHESTETCETALHFIAKRPTATSAMLQLATRLVAGGACVTTKSRPDSIWGVPEMDGQAGSPLELARKQQSSELLRVLLGYTHGKAPDCDCCGDEFVFCCELLEPALPCSHRCCADVLIGWTTALAEEGGTFSTISCPVCLAPMGPELVARYLRQGGQQQLLKKVEQHSLEVGLAAVPGFVWCPRCPSGGVATCSDSKCVNCEYEFCVKCKHSWEAHQGVSCAQLLGSEAGKTVAWLEENTRACPSCSAAIVRSGGCSHMTCRVCAHGFCWLCMGDYNGKITMNPEAALERAQKGGKQVRCPCGNFVKASLFNRDR